MICLVFVPKSSKNYAQLLETRLTYLNFIYSKYFKIEKNTI